MQLGEKISLMRRLKGLTQEEMAERLSMSATGYAKIERGETKLQNPRLERIAQVLGIELKDLFDLDKKNIFNITDNSLPQASHSCNVYLTESQCIHELEKLSLLLQERNKEVEYLKNEVNHLKQIIELMDKIQK
jgi:transcriptional regulator with XRE-family HTH domain